MTWLDVFRKLVAEWKEARWRTPILSDYVRRLSLKKSDPEPKKSVDFLNKRV